MQSLKYLFLTLFILVTASVWAQSIHEKPATDDLVNDFAGILTQEQISQLEYKLRYFHDTTSNQIEVVTVNSLDGYDPATYAYTLGQKWGIGQKDFNNGIVILIKPKKSNTDKGQAFIATGYGLEPVIPDATAKKIVEREMIPNFKNNDYYQGIDQAVDVLMNLASGEISANGYNKSTQQSWIFGILPFIFILIIFLLVSRGQRKSYGIGHSNNLWTALFLGSMFSGGSHGGNWGGGSSGFGGSSGGSGFGGGFSGFGGGSFGGGGAGGSW